MKRLGLAFKFRVKFPVGGNLVLRASAISAEALGTRLVGGSVSVIFISMIWGISLNRTKCSYVLSENYTFLDWEKLVKYNHRSSALGPPVTYLADAPVRCKNVFNNYNYKNPSTFTSFV